MFIEEQRAKYIQVLIKKKNNEGRLALNENSAYYDTR